MTPLPRGTLVTFSSWGNTYHGFIVGQCSYDNAGPDNAYVIRYCWKKDGEVPRKPYTVVDMGRAEPVKDWPENFLVGDFWSASPDDRCKEWSLVQRDGLLFVEPKVTSPVPV